MSDGNEERDAAILGAAMEVFRRFGYRKSSMEDVARAAGVSRQGLYVFFANKQEVFRAAVGFALSMRVETARAALGRGPTEMGLVGALEAWLGEYGGGLMGAETDELVQTARRLAGDVVAAEEARLLAMLGEAIGESELGGAYGRVEVSPGQLAGVLYAMARGFRGSCGTREEFSAEMGVAVRVLVAARG